MQKWLLVVLGFVGGFALISLVGMVLIAVFLLRAVNRFTEATARVSLTAGATPSALLEAGNANLIPTERLEESRLRFQAAVAQLESRIEELEQKTKPKLAH